MHKKKTAIRLVTGITAFMVSFCAALLAAPASAAQAVSITDNGTLEDTCQMEFESVSPSLMELAGVEYIRMDGQPTGAYGGLYPGGSNAPPPAHQADGQRAAALIQPVNADGLPDPRDGLIGLISIGMSNTAMEFQTFQTLASIDPGINPRLRLVNGAQAGQTADVWADAQSQAWEVLAARLETAGLEPAQVQTAWVKLTRTGGGAFPAKALELKQDLISILHTLKERYPNLMLVYLSSRTRSYTYWNGLSPEPAAFETGFAVKWLIQDQINGDPQLNFDPGRGEVLAPYLAWGPYLWADGLNPRADGFFWLPEDLVRDCTHPSDAGRLKVARLLLDFFTSDATSRWFLQQRYTFLPLISSQ